MKRSSPLLGEFLLIVLGVLMALTVDTWVGNWKDRALGREYVTRLMTELESDREALELRIAFFSAVRRVGQQTLDWLESDQPPTAEAMLRAFYSAELNAFVPIRTTYDDLRSTGNIALLDDLDLRLQLGAYYPAAAMVGDWSPPRAYREIVRGVIPPPIQALIREFCPWDVDGRLTEAPTCELPGVGSEDIAAALLKLRSNPEVDGALTFLISETDTSLVLYRMLAGRAQALLDRLTSYSGGSV